MAEENIAETAPEDTETVESLEPIIDGEAAPEEEKEEKIPTIGEDLKILGEKDWVNATISRFRQGKHPNPDTEILLKRRLDFPRQDFLAPYAMRIFCTFGYCVVGCGISWLIFWFVFSIFGFEQFLRELSLTMSILLMVLLGFGLSHPLEIYDEKELEKTGIGAIRELRLQKSDTPQSSDAPDQSN